MRIFIIILISILFLTTSCSVQKRLNRKVDRVEQFAIKHNLTIKEIYRDTIRDTLVIPVHSYDTSTLIQYDTVTTVIDDERLILKYILVDDTIRHYITIKEQEIIREIPVEVEVDKIKNVKGADYTWLWIIVIAIVLILIIRLFTLKKK